MTIERIDPEDWPATITVAPGYYGLRIDTDHGTAVHYVTTPPRTTPAGLVLPDSCWTDECSARAPTAMRENPPPGDRVFRKWEWDGTSCTPREIKC